ncbi:uracil-DNA glycosylase family protein [Candidatus Igneacidithiobacillus taiwanensis]|uniref:uracil-DNA glycosylase family protein n=1 Tax=Candidatus Igneacidithiobacillus taiwanensis TaxID=1945924 RepID=UPI00289B6D20|nr:uracil-DNA glycosylase family protein [Candidatus Igneacidithiobacillus taiwanensis]MCE5361045.1 DUF4918 family protein [Acidithiobacillus sp.]
MPNLLTVVQDRYLQDAAFLALLESHGIQVLQDCLANRSWLEAFWQHYVPDPLPQTVILGLNPGRFGAGQTGIPFVDFRSLSALLPEASLPKQDSEPSATFFHRVVQHIGAEKFYRMFYVSNVSAVGYLRDGKNCNYPDLPELARPTVARNFAEEMGLLRPKRIIALGREVEASAQALFPDGSVRISHLPHPSWIMTYRLREAQSWVRRYAQMLLMG